MPVVQKKCSEAGEGITAWDLEKLFGEPVRFKFVHDDRAGAKEDCAQCKIIEDWYAANPNIQRP